jgi:hypothetical protein
MEPSHSRPKRTETSLNKKMTLSRGPCKGPILLLLYSIPSPPATTVTYMKTPTGLDSFPIIFSPIDSLTSASVLLILCSPSTSQPCQFSPEDADSMFLRNVGTNLQNHTAPKPKTTPSVLTSAVIRLNWRGFKTHNDPFGIVPIQRAVLYLNVRSRYCR